MKALYKIILFTIVFYTSSCRKDWLDAKPDKKLVIPVSLADLQALLDNDIYVFNNGQPSLGEIASDDYYIGYPDWQALYTSTEKNSYVWAKDIYQGESVADWMLPYQHIFYANYILENIDKIVPDSNEVSKWNNIKGSALFFRGFDFYSLADIFSKQFDSATAATDPGIPLRLRSDINDIVARSTVLQTYHQIISDLTASIPFLPDVAAYKTRPSKTSAYAMLARTYLGIDNYALALNYADSCITIQNTLIDYNSLDLTASFPFNALNDEVILHAAINYPQIVSNYVAIVDSVIYASYDTNDLRRYAFIDTTDGYPRFKGGYDGSTGFAGIATDEILLLRAECYARLSNTTAAMKDLNDLLITRWKSGSYIPLAATSADEALALILTERRKELIFRGLRWTDLRRLNKDPKLAITLTRNLNGQLYTLPPNDSRYVYPIPDQEIVASHITQNPR